MVDRARTRGPTLRVVEAPPSVAAGQRRAGPASGPHRGTTPLLDDVEIVEACRRGDPSAAHALHARVRPIVDATVARLLGRKDARSEDLAQIAMIELVRSLAQFRGECSLDTWTGRVTAHAIYKELRRRKLEQRVFVSAGPDDDDPPESGDSSTSAEARSTLRRVRTHLAELDPVKAWTLLLHDVGGYDLKEIAEITGASIAAAQSRLVRARAELHARLEADPELADLLVRRGGR